MARLSKKKLKEKKQQESKPQDKPHFILNVHNGTLGAKSEVKNG